MALKSFNIAIVGAGRVGTLMAKFLSQVLGHRIIAVVSRSDESIERFLKRVKADVASKSIHDLPSEVEVIFITTSDSAIKEVAEKISKLENLNFKNLVVYHTSGVLTSDVLDSLHRCGSEVGSLHPIYSVSHFDYTVDEIKKIKFTLEGSKKIYDITKWIFYNFDSNIFPIDKSCKVLYHIACVFASNYVIALLNAIGEILRKANLNVDDKFLIPLVEASLKNADELGVVNALTGPIERGDLETLELHLNELKDKFPEILPLYSSLAIETIRVAFKKKSISVNLASQMLGLVSSYIGKK
ncbi:Predicted oxidoreductase, contains short-chain dehydrogenase (SDR) and DUF2520 domains [Candidatus Kryptonium thompsonii]|uniref:Predicted oxidoreductase, contains short-chain dehydrogenase (SDR) and DUF2520 domains n=1 Tax=Candidatus Kryptonium thompsonii TaxID=1633631 RepID=A0A0P1M1B9_9BACT|nr:Rossmann-like and DUF2520 domain-containing protein [Candidatus Kryptonium thompsoni]CUS80590.1 Predicted oxidoreductase, contains short-chain dehydrogenase (SDR) and DUF2520 domains [Candidatus Kryptonium thompsoni]CUS85682.1 Predicted oxidoreductase, contains short-chain dehydrogenase (SDR) and DUF2520 domains [Candidatus Kryptonium thompsoni]CUS88432.1 Predicted oxidoreductase, contains short-chain dehydrogenase (SDR) and DUF2520 domains [Candidatus Kryptonium thompsoni]CUS93003.1 Predict